MAVNFANVLSKNISFSGLITTRKEGELKSQLSEDVDYFFLKKKSNYDLSAFLRFRKYVCAKKITFIHAHSSSFFWAVLLKFTLFRVKVIWHDHYGNRVNDEGFKNITLCFFSFFFSHIIAVNVELRDWALSKMFTKRIVFIPNFILKKSKNISDINSKTFLKGDKEKRIVLLANLKSPKNHINFLKAFKMSEIYKNGWTLHFIGKDFSNEYSQVLKDFILFNNLTTKVFFYGSCNDVRNILKQCKVGALSSTFEGFPVTLLEYANANLFVISTNVGYCSTLVNDNVDGLLFLPKNTNSIVTSLKKLNELSDENISQISSRFNIKIATQYDEEVVINEYLRFIQNE